MTNGYFSIEKFKLAIESCYLNDTGTTDNALNMPEKELKKREIIFVDVAKKGNEKLPDDEVHVHCSVYHRMWRFITVKSVTSGLLHLTGTKHKVQSLCLVHHRTGNVLLQESHDSISLNQYPQRP